jgi:hypothetical protein
LGRTVSDENFSDKGFLSLQNGFYDNFVSLNLTQPTAQGVIISHIDRQVKSSNPQNKLSYPSTLAARPAPPFFQSIFHTYAFSTPKTG